MRNLLRQKQIILGVLSICILVSIIAASRLYPIAPAKAAKTPVAATKAPTAATKTPEKKKPDDIFRETLNDAMNMIHQQEIIDQNLLNELKSGAYTFEKPLVVVDPYDISPLTALILFTSPEPLNLSIQVQGVDALTDISFAFDGYNTQHIIPVYGLYPNKLNKVTILSKDKKDKNNKKELEIQTEPLPKELNNVIILTDLPFKDRYQPGLNFTYQNGGKFSKAAFDVLGSYRWFLNKFYLNASTYKFNDHYIFALGSYHVGHVLFIETNPIGRIYKIFYAPYGAHHDIEVYKDNFLITGSEGMTVEDLIYELDTKNGKVIHTLDLKTVLQRSRQIDYPANDPDWFHNNSISWVVEDDAILISGKHQSTIAKISWPNGKINWILSTHQGWLPMFEKFLLDPIGNEFEWQYHQHAPEILPDQDNNPDTMDILLMDNGNTRFSNDLELQRKIANNEIAQPELYSRIVQFRINSKEKTVEQIWQFGKEYGTILYSASRGDANQLSNGNRLGIFEPEAGSDGKTHFGTFFEVTQDSEIVWSAQVLSKQANGNHTEYRLTRMDIYNASANRLQLGEPAINLIPEEIMNAYGGIHE